ncbi:hypothetical protein SAMN06265222_106212 [Neorhodopirellula lusitana]|uniref:Uncharacterized protein n=1 Tax=Neorhodopirellula lusitana TaxID=445327 RepID=A0ABY1Q568_9BACT|nr:hypothetical protein [Neorhodopirellula lusitana]SMP59336.1 hypothetical protein SAMN06265222_106212 [Neorhodopirellula lusitana]
MSDTPTATQDSAEPDPDAIKFAEVTSGIYRRFDAESVWMALRYAVGHQLFNENPTIMLMFVRIAEVYPEARQRLQEQQNEETGPPRQAIDLILDPPQEIRDAQYLPDSIQSPGEMDLCWAEFLVTGKTDVVTRIVAVLDRDDLTRDFLNQQLSDESSTLELSDDERNELQQFGIGIGKLSEDAQWEVMTPGDSDLFLWLAIKNQNELCSRILQAMDEPLQLHLASKGAALWSLQANATQHGSIRLLCEEAGKQPGGFGRKLLIPA